jgi:hypothetical protein
VLEGMEEGWNCLVCVFDRKPNVGLYVVYSESSWTELLEGSVREGGLLTLASPTL